MHYAFDMWMRREFPHVPFERYADDAVVHCANKWQAERVLSAIAARMEEVGLRLHPKKTRLVYCKDGKRRGKHEHTSFTFLGYLFRQRRAIDKTGKRFSSFLPAMSADAQKAKGTELRRMSIHRRTNLTLDGLAQWLNPIVRGWMQYYGRFSRSEMYPLLRRISTYLMRWAWQKYRRLRTYQRFQKWWSGLLDRVPALFAHWKWVRAY